MVFINFLLLVEKIIQNYKRVSIANQEKDGSIKKKLYDWRLEMV